MPRYILVVLAFIVALSWGLHLWGPAESRDAFFGFARGATIGAVVMIGVVSLGTRLSHRHSGRPPRA